MFAAKLLFLLLLLVIRLPQSRQQCQKVLKGYLEETVTGQLVDYNGIEPNLRNCFAGPNRRHLNCGQGTVLNDGDIGPTHSVNLSDPHQVRKFFVWDGSDVRLQFPRRGESTFNASYIDIYTLSVPSAGIGLPGNITFTASTGPVSNVTTQRCSFSSNTNTLSRSTYTVSLTDITTITVRIPFTISDIDWLFISEIQLCEGTPPSSILCSVPLSYPPPSGATVTPDFSQPDSVSLPCSVASPPTDDYQYQWQWWKNGTQLNNDNRLTITHTTNTQSSSLQISGLQYSDEGEYMCRVQYAMCPDGVDCREATPATGRVTLNLPVIIEAVTVFTGESTEAVLECEVYGYPRDSSPPVWTHGSDELHNGRYTTTVTNDGLLNGHSISTTERVVSQLTITNVTANDSGDYTCSWQGNSTTVSLRIAINIGDPPEDIGSGDPPEDIIEYSEPMECETGIPMSVKSGFAALLLISVAINILAMIYCVYRLRRKCDSGRDKRVKVNPLYDSAGCNSSGGGRGNERLPYGPGPSGGSDRVETLNDPCGSGGGGRREMEDSGGDSGGWVDKIEALYDPGCDSVGGGGRGNVEPTECDSGGEGGRGNTEALYDPGCDSGGGDGRGNMMPPGCGGGRSNMEPGCVSGGGGRGKMEALYDPGCDSGGVPPGCDSEGGKDNVEPLYEQVDLPGEVEQNYDA